MATALALGLRLYQLTRPGFLFGVTEYDDGVYFGSAVRLVHGQLPYRDFVLVQPPGIAVLMAPLAWLGNATGTSTAFAVARILTACAGAAAVPLTGLLVRRRGIAATTVACGLLAIYPAGINAAHTVLLEPWGVLLCLLGALAVFDRDRMTERTSGLAWGGAAFGLAAAIKLWAVFPVAVVLVLLWGDRSVRARLAYLGGVLVGFGLPVLPFFAVAPGAFYQDVIVAQLSRVDATRLSAWHRLASLTGLSAFDPVPHGIVLVVAIGLAAFAVTASAWASIRARQPPPALEWFALLTAALVLVAFLWPPDYYLHYAWFFAPFLALSLALPAARLPRLAPVLIGVTVAVVVLMTVVQSRQEARLTADDPGAAARRVIPAGACVLTDISSLTIVADRFVSAVPGCTPIVDAIGTDYAVSRGRNGVTGAGRIPALQALWLAEFRRAQYVWIACPPTAGSQCKTSRRIPWGRPLTRYFMSHFRPVRGANVPANLYVRGAARTR